MNGYLELEIKELKEEVKRLETELRTVEGLASKYMAVFSIMKDHPEIAHTYFWDEHPEDYDDPCLCAVCVSYMEP